MVTRKNVVSREGGLFMQGKLERYYNIFGRVRNSGMIFSGTVVFIMMLYTCADVAFRNIQGYSPLYAYEISQSYFMPLIVFPGLAYTFSVGIMPRIDLLLEKFNDKIKKILHVCLYIFELVLLLLLIIYGGQYLFHAIETNQSFTAGGINYLLWPVILFVPLGFFLVFVEITFYLIKSLYGEKTVYIIGEDDV